MCKKWDIWSKTWRCLEIWNLVAPFAPLRYSLDTTLVSALLPHYSLFANCVHATVESFSESQNSRLLKTPFMTPSLRLCWPKHWILKFNVGPIRQLSVALVDCSLISTAQSFILTLSFYVLFCCDDCVDSLFFAVGKSLVRACSLVGWVEWCWLLLASSLC